MVARVGVDASNGEWCAKCEVLRFLSGACGAVTLHFAAIFMGCGASSKSNVAVAPRHSNVQVRLTREQSGDYSLTPRRVGQLSPRAPGSPNPLLGLEGVLGLIDDSDDFNWDEAAGSSCCIGSCFAVAHIGPGTPPVKNENQDVAICVDDFTGRPGMKLLGIFDGHGKMGKKAAECEHVIARPQPLNSSRPAGTAPRA